MNRFLFTHWQFYRISDDYEKICFVCRRPESRAGKMIVMPNNIYICQDCMQRTFDSINSSGINYEDMMKMSNMPGMGMFGNFGAMDSDPVPEKQKLKKKKEKMGYFLLLPGGLHLCVPDRTGRRCREIRTVPGYGCRSILGKHRLTLRTQSMARCFGKHP